MPNNTIMTRIIDGRQHFRLTNHINSIQRKRNREKEQGRCFLIADLLASEKLNPKIDPQRL